MTVQQTIELLPKDILNSEVIFTNNLFLIQPNNGEDDANLNTITNEEWEYYNFKYNPLTYSWKLNISKNKYIVYNTRCCELLVMNWDNHKSYKSKNCVISELKLALILCNIY
jgi:hypothetical protein